MDKIFLIKVLCTECKKVYTVNVQNKYLFSYFTILAAIPTITFLLLDDSFNLKSDFPLLAGLIILLLLAFYFAFDISRKERNCTLCNGKARLIKIDTPEAMKFIKENNISIPEDSLEDEKFPWETDKP